LRLRTNPKVGLLFIDFEGGSRLRMTGNTTIDDGELAATFPGAELAVRVEAREVFANCRRYVHRYERVERSPFVPTEEVEPPVPDWKLDSWFDGTLPINDPALDPERARERSIPQF
jgi:uncharacterized protein